LAYMLLKQGKSERAIELGEKALVLARAAGAKSAVADSLILLGQAEWRRGKDLRRAVLLAHESLTLSLEIQHTWQLANTLGWLAMMTLTMEDRAQARTYLAESLALSREFDIRTNTVIYLTVAGALALRQGRQVLAATLLGALDGFMNPNFWLNWVM